MDCPCEGMRVRYCRTKYDKFGLEGTITKVQAGGRFYVEWDGGGSDYYSAPAFGPTSAPTFESEGYIQPIDDGSTYRKEQLLVAGVCGGPATRVTGYGAAVELAQHKATNSKSGQEYRIYRAVEGFQKEDPPIKRTKYVSDLL